MNPNATQAGNQPVLLNAVSDALRRLAIGRSMFYELVSAGDIKVVKVGSRTLVPESELVQFVAKQLAKAA